jgi:hypothetical protein
VSSSLFASSLQGPKPQHPTARFCFVFNFLNFSHHQIKATSACVGMPDLRALRRRRVSRQRSELYSGILRQISERLRRAAAAAGDVRAAGLDRVVCTTGDHSFLSTRPSSQ